MQGNVKRAGEYTGLTFRVLTWDEGMKDVQEARKGSCRSEEIWTMEALFICRTMNPQCSTPWIFRI